MYNESKQPALASARDHKNAIVPGVRPSGGELGSPLTTSSDARGDFDGGSVMRSSHAATLAYARTSPFARVEVVRPGDSFGGGAPASAAAATASSKLSALFDLYIVDVAPAPSLVCDDVAPPSARDIAAARTASMDTTPGSEGDDADAAKSPSSPSSSSLARS